MLFVKTKDKESQVKRDEKSEVRERAVQERAMKQRQREGKRDKTREKRRRKEERREEREERRPWPQAKTLQLQTHTRTDNTYTINHTDTSFWI